MKTLIIAAGRGDRLRPFTDGQPKPLTPLLGLRLIERVILSAREAGMKDFVIVTGYMGRAVEEFLGDGLRYGLEIEYVDNRLWEKENGISVYAARKLLKEKFVLLMSDHIFNPGILSDLKMCKLGEKECMLCVDTRMNYVFDMDDATKVKVVDGKILDIGKDLKDYNGVDMGIFLCSPHIFRLLEGNIEEGRYSLTESIGELAAQGRMKAHCVDDYEWYWIDVDTFEDLKTAEKLLLAHSPQTCYVRQEIKQRL